MGKSNGRGSRSPGRILGLGTLAVSIIVLVLALKKPQPIAPPQAPAAIEAQAQSFQDKMDKLESALAEGQTRTEMRFTADEIGAVFAPHPPSVPARGQGVANRAGLRDLLVRFDEDIARGQFVAEMAGVNFYITIGGRLGARDGYATFDATEFKIGALRVPVSLVNSQLKSKLLEQRDRLKLQDPVGEIRVEGGQLVVRTR